MEEQKAESQENTFLSKMKECPSCGEKDWFIFPDMDKNYFLLGAKGRKADLQNMGHVELIKNLIEFPLIPFSCSKCGYTVFLNKTWKY